MSDTPRTAAVLLAGGSGERFGRAGGKQLAMAAGMPVASWALKALADAASIDLLVFVCPADRRDAYYSAVVAPLGLEKPVIFAASGSTRQASVASGMAQVPAGVGVVAVHDGARPLVLPSVVDEAVALLRTSGADGVVIGHPAYDTLKIVDGTTITETPDRTLYWIAQTPQVFRRTVVDDALAAAAVDGFVATDDSGLVEHYGGRVLVMEGPRDNVKVTVPGDLDYVGSLLAARKGRCPLVRIGLGYDVHAFAPERRLVLGGVEIEHEVGLEGHSDADVLAHALMDAIVGALREGDIGRLFPDTDPAFKDADSLVLLARVGDLMRTRGFRACRRGLRRRLRAAETRAAPGSDAGAAGDGARRVRRFGGGQGDHHRAPRLHGEGRGHRGLRGRAPRAAVEQVRTARLR